MNHYFTVDNMGCSQVHLNTDKGICLFDSLDKDKIEYFQITRRQAFQPNLRHPTRKSLAYSYFWTLYKSKGFKKAAFKIGTKKEKIQILLQKLGSNEIIYRHKNKN